MLISGTTTLPASSEDGEPPYTLPRPTAFPYGHHYRGATVQSAILDYANGPEFEPNERFLGSYQY